MESKNEQTPEGEKIHCQFAYLIFSSITNSDNITINFYFSNILFTFGIEDDDTHSIQHPDTCNLSCITALESA